ncbi:sodium-dependent phosphate transport protein 2A-like isoform X1 [Lates japonicus]|uniref:Sodium-dependent phosphate transport protein 2A-like isoform X1 n=1 Tax=Lates japonicus TaxID=270547 RepID=A0AAD3QYY4_LATJO|nr:sodium-dependent phosphate transport protein 2A-like isoform X1 [Lates japonicus]
MSSRSITIVSSGRSTRLDYNGMRMYNTQLSSQPKLALEEDRESGIGSTLDLSGSFDGYSQHTNHHFNKPSLREADRLPIEKGSSPQTTAVTLNKIRQLLISLSKIPLLFILLFLFVCSLDTLSSAFQLAGGKYSNPHCPPQQGNSDSAS